METLSFKWKEGGVDFSFRRFSQHSE